MTYQLGPGRSVFPATMLAVPIAGPRTLRATLCADMLSAPTDRMPPPGHQRPLRPITRLATLLIMALLFMSCTAERPVTATPTVLVPEATPTPTATPTPSAPLCPMSGAGPLSGLSPPLAHEASPGPA